MLGKFYQWFWFHTEFWLTPTNRRPYTFIMRDWLYRHQWLFTLLVVVWFSVVFVYNLAHPIPAFFAGLLTSFLLAHLIWGSEWIEGQQEFPEYLDGGVI